MLVSFFQIVIFFSTIEVWRAAQDSEKQAFEADNSPNGLWNDEKEGFDGLGKAGEAWRFDLDLGGC